MHVAVIVTLLSEKVHIHMYCPHAFIGAASPQRAAHFRFRSSLPSGAIYSDTNF